MRKDSISEKALKEAYLIYSERGHQALDFSHTPTDYARGTVLEPEQTSVINSRFGELYPDTASKEIEYDVLARSVGELDGKIDALQNEMRVSRMRGNFVGLQAQIKELQSLIKRKEAIDAKMATLDLGRKQMDDYNHTMEQDHSYAEKLQGMATRIQELEGKLRNFSEKK